jgi:hypothetical protein
LGPLRRPNLLGNDAIGAAAVTTCRPRQPLEAQILGLLRDCGCLEGHLVTPHSHSLGGTEGQPARAGTEGWHVGSCRVAAGPTAVGGGMTRGRAPPRLPYGRAGRPPRGETTIAPVPAYPLLRTPQTFGFPIPRTLAQCHPLMCPAAGPSMPLGDLSPMDHLVERQLGQGGGPLRRHIGPTAAARASSVIPHDVMPDQSIRSTARRSVINVWP